MSMKRKSCRWIKYWSFAILLNFFLIFFSLMWDIKKVAAYTYTRKGLLNSAFFFSFFFSLSQAYQNVLGVLKKCAPLFLSNFWVTPFLLYFCWTIFSMNMKLFSNYQNPKQIQINYFDNTYYAAMLTGPIFLQNCDF